LVARSPGIDDDIAQCLCQWSPTHDGLCGSDVDAYSLNYYPIDDSRFAISRSMMGGPEYSARQALQTVTNILVGQSDELQAFGFNPVALARTALSMGWLRLEPEYDRKISAVDLPTCGLNFPQTGRIRHESVDAACEALVQGQRVAIIGSPSPLRALDLVFQGLPEATRRTTSFATRIKPSTFRPFRLHFFEQTDNRLRDFLAHQRIVTILWL
jgi:hypothetical protein